MQWDGEKHHLPLSHTTHCKLVSPSQLLHEALANRDSMSGSSYSTRSYSTHTHARTHARAHTHTHMHGEIMQCWNDKVYSMILQCWRDEKYKEIMAFLIIQVMEVMTHYMIE